MIPKPDIPIVSLFSGAGGMDLGFRKAGFLPLLALDSSRAAVDTYNWNNANQIARQCDLSELSSQNLAAMVREVSPDRAPRGVIGGPPCQSFSRGNTRRKRRDPRARLGLVYAHLVRALNQEFGVDFIVLENVVGLRSARHSHRFETIQRALRLAGFNLFVRDLEASDFGVPQHRRRLLVVGVNRDKFPWVKFEFPQGTGKPPTVRQMIVKLPEPTFFQRGLKPEAIAFHPNHWTMNPLSPKFRNGMHGNGRSFKKLAWNRPSFTVAYGNREIHIHPRGRRRLSVFEAMLLQGFPRTYEIRGTLNEQVTQVSDAVPRALTHALSRTFRKRRNSVCHGCGSEPCTTF